MDTPDPGPPGESQPQEPKHWLSIAATSLLLGTLVYAGLLFPFAVTDGLLGLDCHGWVKGPKGAASLLFILGWGSTVAVMAGRVYGRTETVDDLLRIRSRLLDRGDTATKAEGEESGGGNDTNSEDGDRNSP